MNSSRKQRFFVAAALLIACAAAWPLMREVGLLNTRGGGDSPFLLQRLHQLETALRDGHFPVRWMGDANYGYGYPFFNFYAPLSFYVAALFRFIGFSIVRSIQLSQLAAFLLAAGATYGLAREWLKSDWGALVASAAYTVAPFHLVNVYVRGDSIAEFWAMGFYPLVIWGISRWPLAVGRWRELVRPSLWIALAYAGLIVSHNISALIFSPFVLLYALIKFFQVYQTNRSGGFFSFSVFQFFSFFWGGFFLALALGAWFWLPALGEQDLTQLGGITADYFDYNRHFRTVDLAQTTFFFDFGVDTLQAFRMGLVQTLLIAIGCVALIMHTIHNPKSTIQNLFLLFSLLLATLMITPLSKPLWDNLPLLPFTQFPWRFLSVQAFWGALMVGVLVVVLPERWRPWLSIGLMGVLGVSSLGQLQTDYLSVTDTDITAERLAQYEWFTGNIGTTISGEYLASTMAVRPYTSAWLNEGDRWRVNVIEGEAAVTPVVTNTHYQAWRVKSDGGTVVLPLMYWPGWVATVDGEPLALQAAASSGLAQVALPAGEHTLELRLTRTPIRQAAELISLVAVVIVAVGWAISRPMASGTTEARPSRLQLGGLFLFGLALVLAVVLNQSSQRPFPAGTDNWDFGEMGYLHHAPQGVHYGNGALLAGHGMRQTEVSAGDELEITLDWAEQPTGDVREVTIALHTPAYFRFGGILPLVSETRPLVEGSQNYALSIPADAPAGLYVPLVTLSDRNRPRTLSGEPRARELALPPVRVVGGEMAREPSAQQLDLVVDEVALRHTENNRFMEMQMGWWTARPLSQNYHVSVRLLTLDGLELYPAQFDVPLGHGYQPAVTWAAGTWTADHLTVPLPSDENLSLPAPYVLLVQLYDPAVADAPPVLTKRIGYLETAEAGGLVYRPHEPNFARPDGMTPIEAVFVDGVGEPLLALLGYELVRDGELLDITLYWQALGPLTADYTHFVHVLDPQTGLPAAQHDAMPQNNSYPTSQWVVGEVVADRFVVDMTGVGAGEYVLTAGMYEALGDGRFPRLQLVGEGDTITLQMLER